jgi:hypothetical protein
MIGRYTKPWWWWFGIPAPFWIVNLKAIGQFIEKFDLKPIGPESLPDIPMDPQYSMGQEIALRAYGPMKPRPFPGGIKIPHLHFKGDLFVLNEKQWKEFSADILKGFQSKLAKANTVSFGQVMEISDVIDGIG